MAKGKKEKWSVSYPGEPKTETLGLRITPTAAIFLEDQDWHPSVVFEKLARGEWKLMDADDNE